MRALPLLGVVALAACSPASGEGPPAIVVGKVGDAGRPAPVAEGPAGEPGSGPASVELALDESRACVRARGKVHCTTDVTTERALDTAPAIEGISDAISLGISSRFACAATAAGKVLCWGDNRFGQLGAGLRDDRRDTPVPVVGITQAARVFVSDMHACALLRDQSITCWGRNEEGQTGSATAYAETARELAIPDGPLARPRGASSLALGSDATCVVTGGGETWCFGRAHVGGDAAPGARGSNLVPTAIPALAGFGPIAASGGASCGVRQGEVSCWGDTHALVANRPSGAFAVSNVARVALGARARQVRLGAMHACALLEGGAVSCWGSNWGGALGRAGARSDSTNALEPALVAGVQGAQDLVVGGAMACAMPRQGATEAQCWGRFPRGESDVSAKPGNDDHQHDAPVMVRLTR